MAQSTVTPITVKGKAFVKGNERFMVRGMAVTPNLKPGKDIEEDLLGDNYTDYFSRYILPRLKELHVNVVRVYQVDMDRQHKKTMDLLAENGIYAMIDLGNPKVSVNRINPQYTSEIYRRFTAIVAEFCRYDNTFAFSVGNEVVYPGNIYGDPAVNRNTALANEIILKDAALIKSLVRDMKKYMRDNKLRAVPVGMAMQDGDSGTVAPWGLIGTNIAAEYYASGDPAERADYIGINEYRYLNTAEPGNMHSYDNLARQAAMLPVPVMFTESGALYRDPGTHQPVAPRDWKIIPELYTSELLYQNISGTIPFKFFLKKEILGLYREEPPAGPNPFSSAVTELEKTPFGGADNLAAVFGKVKDMIPPMPEPVQDPSAAPAQCNPPMVPCPVGATVSITIMNYADVPLKAVQGGSAVADLEAGSGSRPSSTKVEVNPAAELFIQDGSNWNMVCKVAPGKLKEGAVVKNNVAWGNVACTIG